MTLAERLRKLHPDGFLWNEEGMKRRIPWPELCAVVEAAEEYRQSVMDDAGSYEEGQRWVEAGQRLEAALDTLALRMDEEGL